MATGYDYRKLRDHLADDYQRGQSMGNELILRDRAVVRVLTYLDSNERERMYREAPIHFGLTKQPVFCTIGTHGECPVCEAAKQAGATGDPEELKWAESVQARRRYLFNVVNMDFPPEQRKVQILSAPHTLKQAILAIYTDPAYENAVYVEGRDIILTRTGSGFNTEYNAKIRIEATEFDHDLAQDVFDLDEYGDTTPDLLRDLLGGRAPEGESEKTDRTPPARSTRRTPPSRRATPPEDDPPPPDDGPGSGRNPFEDEVDPVTGEPLDSRPPSRKPPARKGGPSKGGGRPGPQPARPRR